MKFAPALLLPATALALSPGLSTRQTDINTVTDQYLFGISLLQFEIYHNYQIPNTVSWVTDGCTNAPNNPFGFDYTPACWRHDFGYANYRIQNRFTESAKAKIDANFKTDLRTRCEDASPEAICNSLADVYYAAVQAFGGQDATPGKRATHADLIAEYEDKLAIYNALLQEAIDEGLVPANTTLAKSQVQEYHHGVRNRSKMAELPRVTVRGPQA